MPDNALTIARNVVAIAGGPTPASLNDTTGSTLRALLDMGGKELVRHKNAWGGFWSGVQREYLFTTSPNQTEYQLPS